LSEEHAARLYFGNKCGLKSGANARAGERRLRSEAEKSGLEISIATEDAVVRHVNHHDPFHVLLRANRLFMLAVLWAALAACIVVSLAFDVAGWLSAWRDVSFGMLSSALAV
jgi:hypothetical protein